MRERERERESRIEVGEGEGERDREGEREGEREYAVGATQDKRVVVDIDSAGSTLVQPSTDSTTKDSGTQRRAHTLSLKWPTTTRTSDSTLNKSTA